MNQPSLFSFVLQTYSTYPSTISPDAATRREAGKPAYFSERGRTMQKLLGQMRCAIDRYHMIEEGDRIAVGVSGGKDSVALLAGMSALRRFYPARFELVAVTLDPCFGGAETDYSPIEQLCKELEIEYRLRRTELGTIIFETRKEKNPCSLCARMRRGMLHDEAKAAGCNKIALGHHMDDAAETLMMNLLGGGVVECFSPVSYLSRKKLTIIRPLIFSREREIASLVERKQFPVVKSRCPADGATHRQRVKELLDTLEPQYAPLREKLVGALQRGGISGW